MSHPEAVASGATAATSPADLAVAACLRPVVYEAHTVLSSGNKPEETPSSGTRTRQRKMGIAMAPDMPLETSHAEAPPPVPPPAPVPSFTIPSNVKQSSLRVGEDCVCHRFVKPAARLHNERSSYANPAVQMQQMRRRFRRVQRRRTWSLHRSLVHFHSSGTDAGSFLLTRSPPMCLQVKTFHGNPKMIN